MNQTWRASSVTVVASLMMSMFPAGFALAYPIIPSTTNLFTDGFEAPAFLNWTQVPSEKWNEVGGDTHAGVRVARAKGNTGVSPDNLTTSTSTVGYQNITFSYWYKVEANLDSHDHLKAQWSTNGTTWNTVANYTDTEDGSWTQQSFDLPGAANNAANLQIRFQADFNDSKDEVRIDDVSITGDLTPGSIEIKKYACPVGTTVVRSVNGVGGVVPNGCVAQSGKTFGYVHGTQTDANEPYPELTAPLTAGGSTGENGILSITGLDPTGRYLVVETDSNNNQLPANQVLGLYCTGDGDTSNNNDNQELTFVAPGAKVQCVAYDAAHTTVNVHKVVVGGPAVLKSNFSYTINEGTAVNFDSNGNSPSEVASGSYTVQEVPALNYNTTYSAGCIAGNIALGETKECTITNTYITPPPPKCDAVHSSQNVVSDTTSTVDGTAAFAAHTYVHPAWLSESAGAIWIWNTALVTGPSAQEAHTFTKTFTVVGTATGGTLQIAADNGYDVKVNGHQECASNITDPHYAAYEPCVIPATDFVPGLNTLVVTATNAAWPTEDPHVNPAGVLYNLTVDQNACVPAPVTSDVTMCKYNGTVDHPLAGWTLTLAGDSVEYLTVPTNASAGINTVNTLTTGTSYIATASSTWLNSGQTGNFVDAEYSTQDNWATHFDGFPSYQSDILELQINSAFDPNSNWGAYNAGHTYAQSFLGTGGTANFRIFDGTGTTPNESWYSDNQGTLNVNVSKGYAGITGVNGCVTFKAVPVGNYTAGEVMQDGWSNVSGTGPVVVAGPTDHFNIVNKSDEIACNPDASQLIVSRAATLVDTHNSYVLSFLHSSWISAGTVDPSAVWIWNEDGMSTPTVTTTKVFTDTFTVTGTPSAATLTLAADNHYSVSVNGDAVPSCSSTDEDNFSVAGAPDTCVIPSSMLIDGSNTITFTVTNVPLPTNPESGTAQSNPAGLLYKIAFTQNECTTPDPTTLKVHIYKYLQTNNDGGAIETQVPNGAGITPFPMTATWMTVNLNGGSSTSGNYVLGNFHGQPTLEYAADTSPMQAPADYTTSEVTDGSVVLPIDSKCEAGKYQLVGYRSGTSLAAAESATLMSAAPVYAGLISDRYVIVVNRACPGVPAPICNADTNLVANGSFETPVVTDNGGTWQLYPNATPLLGWTVGYVSGNATPLLEIQRGVSGWLASNGAQWAELDSNEPSTVYQDIATIPGDTYNFSFDFAARPDASSLSDNTMKVTWGGDLVVATSTNLVSAGPNTAWIGNTYSVVATTTATRVQFSDLGTPNGLGGFLDNVALRCVGKVTPKPITVNIYKYMKNNGITAPATSPLTASFPMTANWNAVNIGAGGPSDVTAGPSNFSIGPVGFATSTSYAAQTSDMSVPADYSVAEFTGEGSNVLSPNSRCVADKYRLVGYKTGDSVAAAESAAVATSFPAFTGLTHSKYVIVVNESCNDVLAPVDLSLTKTVDDTTPDVGQTITYTITVTNNSVTKTATNVSVTDVLPAGLTFVSTSTSDVVGVYNNSTHVWAIGSLPQNSSASLHIKATVNSGKEGNTITNTASVSETDSDPTPANNSGTVSAAVNQGEGGGGSGHGTITLIKKTAGGDGTFTINTHEHCASFLPDFIGFFAFPICSILPNTNSSQLTTITGSSTPTSFSVQPGHYDITEVVPGGWNLTNVHCVYDNESIGNSITNGENITIDSGDTVVCTFTNTKQNNTAEAIVVKAADLATGFADVVSNPTKWFYYNDNTDTINNALGSFVTGPAVAPIGTGSSQIALDATNNRTDLATYAFSSTTLARITNLKFSAYSHSGVAGATESPYLVFNVSFNGADTWQKRLVYVPSANGAVPQDAWNTYDAINGGSALWTWSGYASSGNMWPDGNTTEYRTWNALKAAFPQISIRKTDSFVGVRVGEPGPTSYTGNIDKFVIGIQTGLNTDTKTFDFEPTTVVIEGGGGNPTPTIVTGGGGGGNGPVFGFAFGGGGGGSGGSVLGASTTTLPELPAGCTALLTTYMRLGKKNNSDEVKKLQQFLNDEMHANLGITGVFGNKTDKAVKAFQAKFAAQVLTPWGLNDSTGFVYRTTQRWINLIHCKSLTIPLPTNLIPYHNEDL